MRVLTFRLKYEKFFISDLEVALWSQAQESWQRLMQNKLWWSQKEMQTQSNLMSQVSFRQSATVESSQQPFQISEGSPSALQILCQASFWANFTIYRWSFTHLLSASSLVIGASGGVKRHHTIHRVSVKSPANTHYGSFVIHLRAWNE